MADDEAEARRAEVRKRLEEEAAANKKKKPFMTPSRKSKLRMLLRKKAADELKKEEIRRKEERIRIINERCGDPKHLEAADEEGLLGVVQQYYQRILSCESQKYDLELQFLMNEYDISELNRKVQDLRGRFNRPHLKKVAKYEDKFAKLNKSAKEINFKASLKVTVDPSTIIAEKK